MGGILDFGIKPYHLFMGDKVNLLRNSRSSRPSDSQMKENILSPGLIQSSNKLYKLEGVLASLLLDCMLGSNTIYYPSVKYPGLLMPLQVITN